MPFSALCFNLESGKVCCLFSWREVLKVWLCGNKVFFSSKPSFSISTIELWTLNLVIYKAHPRKIKNMIYKKEQWVLDTEKEEMPLCCFTELEGNWKTPSLKTTMLDSQGNSSKAWNLEVKPKIMNQVRHMFTAASWKLCLWFTLATSQFLGKKTNVLFETRGIAKSALG